MAARILLCVESIATRKIINQCFAGEQLEIVPVSNAELAQYLLDLIYPDLVIADTSLPDESAHWLCNYIRQNAQFSHLPVVMLVGIENVSEQSPMPPALSALRETVRKLLQSAGENRTVFFVAESANQREPDFIGPVHLEDARQRQVELEDAEKENLTFVNPETNSLSLTLRGQQNIEPAEQSLAIVPAEQSLARAAPARRGSRRVIVGALVALLLLAIVIAIGYLMRPTENLTSEQASARRAEDARQITPENKLPEVNRTNEGEAQAPLDSPETASESAERTPTRAASLARAADRNTRTRQRPAVRPASQPVAISRAENARPSAAVQSSPATTLNNNGFRQNESLVTRPRRVDSAKTQANVESANGFVEAGKKIGSGVKRIGTGAKTGIVWSGKKVVSGIRFIGRNLKRAFSR